MTFRRARDERGAAAVEMAFILPILIALIGGIVDFGFAFNAQIGLAHAAREGVRVEAIGAPGADGKATAEAAYVSVLSSSVAVATVEQDCSSGTQARVSISVDHEFFFLKIFLPIDGTTFESEAVMRCGG